MTNRNLTFVHNANDESGIRSTSGRGGMVLGLSLYIISGPSLGGVGGWEMGGELEMHRRQFRLGWGGLVQDFGEGIGRGTQANGANRRIKLTK